MMPATTQERRAFLIDLAYYVALVLIGAACVYAAGVIWPFLVALLICACIHPLARWVSSKLHVKKGGIFAALLLIIYVGLSALIVRLVIWAAYALRDLLMQVPTFYRETLVPAFDSLGAWLEGTAGGLGITIDPTSDTIKEGIASALSGIVDQAPHWGVSILQAIMDGVPSVCVSLLFVVIMSVFISLNYDVTIGFIKRYLPQELTDRVKPALKAAGEATGSYIRALGILMVCTFVELSIGLSIIGVDQPILCALGIAVFDVLPVFGTGGIMIPWSIISLLQGDFALAGKLLVLYLIVTVIRNIIEPKVVGDQLGLNPVASVLAVYVGLQLGGAVGMIACPILLTVVMVLVRYGVIPRPRIGSQRLPEQSGGPEARPPAEG